MSKQILAAIYDQAVVERSRDALAEIPNTNSALPGLRDGGTDPFSSRQDAKIAKAGAWRMSRRVDGEKGRKVRRRRQHIYASTHLLMYSENETGSGAFSGYDDRRLALGS